MEKNMGIKGAGAGIPSNVPGDRSNISDGQLQETSKKVSLDKDGIIIDSHVRSPGLTIASMLSHISNLEYELKGILQVYHKSLEVEIKHLQISVEDIIRLASQHDLPTVVLMDLKQEFSSIQEEMHVLEKDIKQLKHAIHELQKEADGMKELEVKTQMQNIVDDHRNDMANLGTRSRGMHEKIMSFYNRFNSALLGFINKGAPNMFRDELKKEKQAVAEFKSLYYQLAEKEDSEIKSKLLGSSPV
jgi:hypothetical protein